MTSNAVLAGQGRRLLQTGIALLLYSSLDGFVIPVVIVVLTWTVFWFAWHSQKKGWLA